MRDTQRNAKWGVVASMLIFGTIGIFRRWTPLPSALVALTRAAVGTLVLAGYMIIRGIKPDLKGIRRQWLPLVASGAVLGFNWICLFEAYHFTTVSVATLSYYMAPVMIVLLSPLLFRERLTVKSGLCVVMGIGGMALISGVFSSGDAGLKGILYGLAAAGMYAAVVILNKRIHGVSGLDRTLVQLGVSAAVLLPYALLTGSVSVGAVEGQTVFMLLVMGVVHTGLAYLMYFGSVEKVPAQTAAVLSYIDPAASLILSALLLGERMDAAGVLGTALILGSALISQWEGKKSALEG